MFDNAANLRKTGDIMPIFQEKKCVRHGGKSLAHTFFTQL